MYVGGMQWDVCTVVAAVRAAADGNRGLGDGGHSLEHVLAAGDCILDSRSHRTYQAPFFSIQGTPKLLQDIDTGPTLAPGQLECRRALFAAHRPSAEYPCLQNFITHGIQTIISLCVSVLLKLCTLRSSRMFYEWAHALLERWPSE